MLYGWVYLCVGVGVVVCMGLVRCLCFVCMSLGVCMFVYVFVLMSVLWKCGFVCVRGSVWVCVCLGVRVVVCTCGWVCIFVCLCGCVGGLLCVGMLVFVGVDVCVLNVGFGGCGCIGVLCEWVCGCGCECVCVCVVCLGVCFWVHVVCGVVSFLWVRGCL